jgi:hypothetical protein
MSVAAVAHVLPLPPPTIKQQQRKFFSQNQNRTKAQNARGGVFAVAYM